MKRDRSKERDEALHCDAMRAHMDDVLDGALARSERRAFDAHVARCATCSTEFARRHACVEALSTAPLPATPPEHVAAVMDRVRAAAHAGDEVDVALAPLAGRRRSAAWLTHLVAAAIGAAIVWFLLAATDSRSARTHDGSHARAEPGGEENDARTDLARVTNPDADTDARPRGAPVVVFHPLDLSGVRRVEVPVEVPVRVEVPVEIPVPGADAAARRRLAAAGSALAQALERSAVVLDAIAASALRAEEHAFAALELARANVGRGRNADVRDGAAADDFESPLAPAPLTTRSSSAVSSPLTISRSGAGVRIALHGSNDVVVPALIARLDDRDRAVRDAVERRLFQVADRLGVDGPRTDDDAADPDDPWWRSRRGQAATAALGPQGDATDRAELWRAWWELVRRRSGASS